MRIISKFFAQVRSVSNLASYKWAGQGERKPPVHKGLRTLWSLSDNHEKTLSVNYVMELNFYDAATFRGEPVSDNIFARVSKDIGKKIGLRGMRKEEALTSHSSSLYGLLGQKDLLIRNEDGTINKEKTKEMHKQHVSGQVRGISSSESVTTAFNYSGLLLSENSTVIVVDYTSIPEEHKIDASWLAPEHPYYPPDFEAEKEHFPFEYEITLTDIAPWSIIGSVRREGMTLKCNWNPLYIDKTILEKHEEMRERFDELEVSYFKACQWVRNNPQDARIVTVREQIKSFYQDYAKVTKMGEGQIADIFSTIKVLDEVNAEDDVSDMYRKK